MGEVFAMWRVGRSSAASRGVVGLASLIVCFAVLNACVPPPPPAGRVIIYGDSLVLESRTEIESQVTALRPGADVIIRSIGGSAHCDWLGIMRSDVSRYAPTEIVVAFFGNMQTPCTSGRDAVALYSENAESTIRLARDNGVRLAFVGAPPRVGSTKEPVPQAYRAVAQAAGLPFIDSAPRFTSPTTGQATTVLPCTKDEGSRGICLMGLTVVRNADGLHLCTTKPIGFSPCAVASAGTMRYAESIASAATQAALPR